MIALLRKLVGILGRPLVYTLPPVYRPAGWAFLYGIANTKLDCERSVPTEILPTVALAVLCSIYEGCPPDYDRKIAEAILNKHDKPVPVQHIHYPEYGGQTLPGYEEHPHYYVMGAFVATPMGNGYWKIEDRYDWHFPFSWRIPSSIARRIPKWILRIFARYDGGNWYIEEVGILDKITVPYWHRSVVRLSDYLDPKWFQ
jgi:hypothetical protein